MYIPTFVFPLLVGFAVTAGAQDDDQVNATQLRLPTGNDSRTGLRPLPIPITPPGIGYQNARPMGRKPAAKGAQRCGPTFGSCPEGYCCDPLGLFPTWLCLEFFDNV